MRWQTGLLRQFASDRGGAVILIFGLSLLMLGLSVGLAVDGGRAYSVATRVGSALDAAALSAAKQLNETSLNDAEIQAATIDTLNAHLANLGVGGVAFTNKAVTIDRANSSATVTADVVVGTTLGRIAGINLFDFTKSATSTYELARIELVMALDITGSMKDTPAGDSSPKISALKTVAAELVNSLYDMAMTDTNIRIGIVPWSSAVNAGPYAGLVTGMTSYSSWSQPSTSYSWGGHGTSPSTTCVVERSGSGATTDDPPSASNFASTAITAPCPAEDVLPLVGRSERASILSTISNFTASGGTAGHIGAAWGWYLISPKWAQFLPSASRPDPYNSRTVKSVLIMTDGIFNTDYMGGGAVGGYDDTSYAQFQQICTGMRTQGINVYTIAFDLSDSRAQSELSNCAGNSANYFNASSAAQLRTAFASIIARLTQIRVSR